ncbi:MAG: prepilin-type N-terminal cleavage/methylation domain-containing protein [Gemmatimonadota bacterium]|nr:prepilin-type N-terminal cleavage/methylation domain-containing protein [Gemmatimonadota bacterium]
MRSRKGFSLIEVIVAVAIIAILSAAIVPVMINKADQARFTRIMGDLEAIYEASIGTPSEDYFAFVGDIGRLPDSTGQLLDSTGQGSLWNGPYISLGGEMRLEDPYGSPYQIGQDTIVVRSFGRDRIDNNGGGDDLVYPETPMGTYHGYLEVRVFINGRLITDAAGDLVAASLSYSNSGSPATMNMTFNATGYYFTIDSVHQGSHEITVVASKQVLGGQDPVTTHKEDVKIKPGATTRIDINFDDADYMTRLDTDLNGNGIPDRLEDMDGDGIPDDMDPDRDGDGTPNEIDPDPDDPTISGGGGPGVDPIVTSVTPDYGNQGDTNLALIIEGSNFQNGCAVSFSGTGITVTNVTFNSSTQLSVTVNISGTAPVGWRNVTVDNPDGSSGTGNSKFQVLTAGTLPPPVINQVTPDNANQGDTNLPVAIYGENFRVGVQVTFSNAGITIVSGSRISDTEIQGTINVSPTATPGAGTVRVTNTDDGQFDEATFTVNSMDPVITSLVPNNANRSQTLDVMVNGSNFLPGIQASASTGTPSLTINSTTRLSSTQVRLNVTTGWWLWGRVVQITLTNPGGGNDSAAFTIN